MRYPKQTRIACGSKEFDPPSRFPPGKAGAGMVPPTPGHVSCQPTALSRSVHRLPPQEGFQSAPLKSPLRDPPYGSPGDTFTSKALAGMLAGTVKHHLVLGMAPLAGFEVITDGRF
jgi:hypothetical protein